MYNANPNNNSNIIRPIVNISTGLSSPGSCNSNSAINAPKITGMKDINRHTKILSIVLMLWTVIYRFQPVDLLFL